MMKRIFLIICNLIAPICLASLHAQTDLPQKVEVTKPNVLLKEIIKESETEALINSGNWGQGSKSEKYWAVYSDRSHNKTYSSPSASSQEFGELAFNENVRIARIENNFALVYTEELRGVGFPLISNKAKSRGWIPMQNLLLWDRCPTDEHGIYKKAVIVTNLDGVRRGKANLGLRYDNPEIGDGATELVSDMNFYFVMKHGDGDLVLLAKECKMEGYTDRVLYGWVSENSYAPWSQRTCIEPNWDPIVAENMKGYEVPVYMDGQKVTSIRLGRENGITSNPSTKYRLEPELMRYPLLKSGQQYYVTAFARPNGQGHVPTVPTGSTGGAVEITNKHLEDANTINLIIVIDGTRSMESFYKPIQEAVRSAYETFGKDNKVKVGVVIYRDYADGDYLTEKLTMREATDPSIAQFLTTGGKYGIKSSPNDRTMAEALYKGLEIALDASGMGYKKENSNLMFVVGDCGNDLNDTKCVSQEVLIERCAQNNVQIIAFQVRNENDAAFNQFRRQMGDIIRGNLKKQGAFNVSSPDWAKFQEVEDGYQYATSRPNNETYFIGAMRHAASGGTMEIQKLNGLIKDCYASFAYARDSRAGIIYNASNFARETSAAASATHSSMEMSILESIFSKEELDQLRQQNSLMAFNGYTDIQDDNDQNYWQPIIYIESNELKQLMEKLAPVKRAAEQGNRKPYVEAMKALVRSMNPEITEGEMGNMDVRQIMDMVSGLNVQTNSLGRHTLLQIQDENVVNEETFNGMVTDFVAKYRKLETFLTSKYDFSVSRNKTKWYWIPVSDLP